MQGVEDLVKTGDFTLGKPLQGFEEAFAKYCGVKHAIGVGNGTDALILSLKAVGIGGDHVGWQEEEVITTPFTFVATVGAIVACRARPVFVDNGDDLCIDPTKIEAKVTRWSRAILPVHWAGNMANIFKIRHSVTINSSLHIVEDACQAVGASEKYVTVDDRINRRAGSLGTAAAFSLHPLKNLNCFGDGGFVTTNDDAVAAKIKSLRNHGLINRDEVAEFGYNSRLDTLQAIVCLKQMPDLDKMLDKRIAIANRYNEAFDGLKGVKIPKPRPGVRHTYHLYQLKCDRRDEFLSHLTGDGVEAKIHYPIPVHLQSAAKHLGYKPGDFPQCEDDCRRVVSLPVHPYLTEDEVNWTIQAVRSFYEPKPL
jgi:dTDP-4-amino-4,6-dideoxygalactose transaminase